VSFKEMVQNDLPLLYTALGDPAVFSRSGLTVYLIPEEDFDIEHVEYKKFKAIISDVDGIAEGDTFTMDGVALEVRNFNPSDDGLEMYIGVV